MALYRVTMETMDGRVLGTASGDNWRELAQRLYARAYPSRTEALIKTESFERAEPGTPAGRYVLRFGHTSDSGEAVLDPQEVVVIVEDIGP